jgi:hypothetical protein
MKQAMSVQKEAKASMKKGFLGNEAEEEKLSFESFDRRRVIEYLWLVVNHYFMEKHILNYLNGAYLNNKKGYVKDKIEDCINKQMEEEQ